MSITIYKEVEIEVEYGDLQVREVFDLLGDDAMHEYTSNNFNANEVYQTDALVLGLTYSLMEYSFGQLGADERKLIPDLLAQLNRVGMLKPAELSVEQKAFMELGKSVYEALQHCRNLVESKGGE